MSAILTAESVVKDCDVLSQLEVRKNRAVYEPTDLNFGRPLEARYLAGQYDLLCKIGDTVYPPAFRRVTKHWQLRQPIELLQAMGFDNFSESWGFRHESTDLVYENKSAKKDSSVTGVKLQFTADLEERYTKNLGKHSINFSIQLSWNGCQADKIRVWLLDRWCSNGQTKRNGLYSVNVNHSKNLTDYVDQHEIYSRIEDHLEWKSSLAHIKLARPLEAEVLRMLEYKNENLIRFTAATPDRTEYVDHVLQELCHEDFEWRKPWKQDKKLSQSMRVLSFPRDEDMPEGCHYPAVSRRRLTQVGTAVQQESARFTWRGDTMLDLQNVLTRMYCQDDKVMTAALEKQFNQLVKSYTCPRLEP